MPDPGGRARRVLLLEDAAVRFAAMDLEWHAAETRKPLP
jgi:hypothetical protein